jgi:hypothetical protein
MSASAPRADALTPDWRRWIAEALLEGHAPAAVSAQLVGRGLDAARAEVEVHAVQGDPLFDLLRARGSAVDGRTERLVSRLTRERLSASPGVVERRSGCDADAFYRTYVAHGAPVHLTGFCADWPARATWTPDRIAARMGEVEITVCRDRAADPQCDRNFKRYEAKMKLAEYVALMRTQAGNHCYMIANNRNLDGPLAALLDDLAPPPGFVDRFRLKGGASLWMGPAGTHTPTHHDCTSVLFCQLYGRKVVWLASPAETRLAAHQDGFYAPVLLSDHEARKPGGALAGATIYEVELAPGDAMLLPVGWWHEVRALDESVSCSITALRTTNRYDTFTPGFSPQRRAPKGPHA